jgi:hypothetical protein
MFCVITAYGKEHKENLWAISARPAGIKRQRWDSSPMVSHLNSKAEIKPADCTTKESRAKG